jgi:DNA-binding transcriptional LysR family regulator
VEFRHLRYFRDVAQELHFGRAAARLHMEPQPLSFQMKQFEREIGFALFSHRENRTQLTAAGAAFLTDADAILASADRAVEHAAQVARGESGLLRIGAVSSLVHAFLAPAIKQFHSAYREVSFDLQTLRAGELENALNRREIDLGFMLLPVPDENYDALVISRARAVLAVPAEDPLAKRVQIDWDDLDGQNAISLEYRGSDYQRRIDDMLDRHGVGLKTVQNADSIEAALAFVGAGLGVAIVPFFISSAPSDDVSYLRLPDDAIEMNFAAIWRRDGVHPLCARFLEATACLAGSIRDVQDGNRTQSTPASLIDSTEPCARAPSRMALAGSSTPALIAESMVRATPLAPKGTPCVF